MSKRTPAKRKARRKGRVVGSTGANIDSHSPLDGQPSKRRVKK